MSSRYIGVYRPGEIRIHVKRYDPIRQLIVDTMDRQRVLQAIAEHLRSNITRHGVRTFRDAYR